MRHLLPDVVHIAAWLLGSVFVLTVLAFLLFRRSERRKAISDEELSRTMRWANQFKNPRQWRDRQRRSD